MIKTLYNKKTLIGRLHFSVPIVDTIYTDFGIYTFHLVPISAFFIWNNRKITECILLCMFLCKSRFSRLMNITAQLALKLISEPLQIPPVFLCIDNIIQSGYPLLYRWGISQIFSGWETIPF